MSLINLEMKFEKTTKNTVVYKSENPESAIPTLYIKKQVLGQNPPDVISVTVTTIA